VRPTQVASAATIAVTGPLSSVTKQFVKPSTRAAPDPVSGSDPFDEVRAFAGQPGSGAAEQNAIRFPHKESEIKIRE
jgi:hypothetical protein